jgi:hypothetical protein
MKKVLIVVCVILTLGCVTPGAKISPEVARMAHEKPNITLEFITKNPPDVYCEIITGPDPILLGGWVTRVENNNPVEFWLVKKEGQYAFYFFLRDDATFKDTPHSQWREMTIFGDQIYSPGKSFHFYTEGGRVYYKYKGGKPWEMKRIEE